MNQLRGIHENYFIQWTLVNALICYWNGVKVLIQSDMPLCQWSSSRKGTFINPIQIEELLAYYQHKSLCRSVELSIGRTALNCLVVYDHHSKSSITFQKIKFLLQMPFSLLKLQILHRNRKCAKLMELSDLKMDWTNSVGYGQIG